MGADPFTIMAITAAASSVVGGMGAAKAGKANQAIHNHNASILRMRANEFVSAAAKQADLERDQNKRLLAKNATTVYKSGVEMAGSPVEVLGEQAGIMEWDAQMTKYKGKLQAWEAETEAANQEYMGSMAAWRGKQQKKAAFISAGISLAGAAYGSFGGFGGNSATAGISPTAAPTMSGGWVGSPNTYGRGMLSYG
jgi:hypothetical protein